MAARINIRGAAELAAAFRSLGRNPTQVARRKARQAAGKIISEAAKANLVGNDSVVTGALVQSMGVAENTRRANSTLIGSRAGKFKKMSPSSYAHFVEFGTAPHWQPNRFGGIMHPGARPKPFLRPAFEEHITDVAAAYFQAMKVEIEQAAARISSRAPRGPK
jgi:HK97 gp10 family phage protein